ncbi:hypothetical protein F5887DRAFT_967271 [Amanita rubescens]|nr:hypothetical protein F5887DRAFT_992593 [Amanita rubescens]KAF8345231.1 hypothetical protein F5887DRAFT_967271 [Amanita rubescens]
MVQPSVAIFATFIQLALFAQLSIGFPVQSAVILKPRILSGYEEHQRLFRRAGKPKFIEKCTEVVKAAAQRCLSRMRSGPPDRPRTPPPPYSLHPGAQEPSNQLGTHSGSPPEEHLSPQTHSAHQMGSAHHLMLSTPEGSQGPPPSYHEAHEGDSRSPRTSIEEAHHVADGINYQRPTTPHEHLEGLHGPGSPHSPKIKARSDISYVVDRNNMRARGYYIDELD